MTAIHAPRPTAPSVHLRFAGLGMTTLAVALLSAYLLLAVRPSLIGPGSPAAFRVLDALPVRAFDRACHDHEPWYDRYVGGDLAAQIVASGLTRREVIWSRQ